MASIFTYDPDPPRISSPWLKPADSRKSSTPQPNPASKPSFALQDYGVTKLEAEPQDGPTEYKLHLLLRPRRTYSSSSTSAAVFGSQQQKLVNGDGLSYAATPILASSNQSRQNRLEQLTTQLLWRLQQSSPYHASSTSDLILPQLPEAKSSLKSPASPGKLLAGLEESRGALYEIGVSDDGTFVGITKDEMDESLTNLRAMAASLRCNVEVLRMVVVGDCEWQEASTGNLGAHVGHLSKGVKTKSNFSAIRPSDDITCPVHRQAQLWVAEALITPDLSSQQQSSYDGSTNSTMNLQREDSLSCQHITTTKHSTTSPMTEELRITLTGPTTSGKSSLLGTLSTATLDNGRGKSRLSLLKHRHEIATGVTSSVAQELIGYKDSTVVNYASGNVTSWTDIHASAEHGRLVFVCDSAGHPRYRRTTVRGLVGWAPHWTFLCVAADEGENAPSSVGGTSSASELLGSAGVGIDLAKAHLELCLKLDRPLSIVITKLDLASKTSLRHTLSKILSAVKATGRTPLILPPDQAKSVTETDLATTSKSDEATVRGIIQKMKSSDDLTSVVPILMTSAAKGNGVRLMHTLLKNLPIPPAPTPFDLVGLALNPEQPTCLFHIEDVFGFPAAYEPLASSKSKQADYGTVVAGILRYGTLSVGDSIVTGPFPADFEEYSLHTGSVTEPRSSPLGFKSSQSHPSTTELSQIASRDTTAMSVSKGEWLNARIVSMRNLRLPVLTLIAGQVGTIGIVFDLPNHELPNETSPRMSPSQPRLRKGMVMAIPSQHILQTDHTLQAASGFTASFEDGDINSVTAGSLVVVYIASIRASARVLRLIPNEESDSDTTRGDEVDDVFGLDEPLEKEGYGPEPLIFGSDGTTDVTLELITNREWIELGSQVLVMPGGGHGLYSGSERGEKGVAGLEGFVGKVIEVVES